ncbi:hypothetical protein PR048_031601 [Dryococelus australis]|uniref:Uncharacterized protein n=1 Tax=Dryococelus australis TaxID=614101 RepID=A0ABQ9G9S6_9NEOP|nr:hypothetical protein PR048_031601 [Dryococelus australis]
MTCRLDSTAMCVLEPQMFVHWLLLPHQYPVLFHTWQYGTRPLFPCKSAIGSESSRECLINCGPIAKATSVYTCLAFIFITVWCGVLHDQLIELFIFPGRWTGVVYLQFLQEELLLEDIPSVVRRRMICQHDVHVLISTVLWFNTYMCISLRDVPSPLDYCVWGWMNDNVYQRTARTREELLACIMHAATEIKDSRVQLRRETRTVQNHAAKCMEEDGKHSLTLFASLLGPIAILTCKQYGGGHMTYVPAMVRLRDLQTAHAGFASSDTIPTCENPGVTPSGMEPDLISIVQRHCRNTARLARRSDEALEVRVCIARIDPSLLDLGLAGTCVGSTRRLTPARHRISTVIYNSCGGPTGFRRGYGSRTGPSEPNRCLYPEPKVCKIVLAWDQQNSFPGRPNPISVHINKSRYRMERCSEEIWAALNIVVLKADNTIEERLRISKYTEAYRELQPQTPSSGTNSSDASTTNREYPGSMKGYLAKKVYGTATRADVPESQKDDDVPPAVARLQISLQHHARMSYCAQPERAYRYEIMMFMFNDLSYAQICRYQLHVSCLLSQWKAPIGPAFSRRLLTPCAPMAKVMNRDTEKRPYFGESENIHIEKLALAYDSSSSELTLNCGYSSLIWKCCDSPLRIPRRVNCCKIPYPTYNSNDAQAHSFTIDAEKQHPTFSKPHAFLTSSCVKLLITGKPLRSEVAVGLLRVQKPGAEQTTGNKTRSVNKRGPTGQQIKRWIPYYLGKQLLWPTARKLVQILITYDAAKVLTLDREVPENRFNDETRSLMTTNFRHPNFTVNSPVCCKFAGFVGRSPSPCRTKNNRRIFACAFTDLPVWGAGSAERRAVVGNSRKDCATVSETLGSPEQSILVMINLVVYFFIKVALVSPEIIIDWRTVKEFGEEVSPVNFLTVNRPSSGLVGREIWPLGVDHLPFGRSLSRWSPGHVPTIPSHSRSCVTMAGAFRDSKREDCIVSLDARKQIPSAPKWLELPRETLSGIGTSKIHRGIGTPNSSLSIAICCYLLEKAFPYLTLPLRIRQHRHCSCVIRVQTVNKVIEVDMERRRNEGAGETGDPRENLPTNDIGQLQKVIQPIKMRE